MKLLNKEHIDIIKKGRKEDEMFDIISILKELKMTGVEFREAYINTIKDAKYTPKDNTLLHGFDLVYDETYVSGTVYNPIREKILLLDFICKQLLGLDEVLFLFYLQLSGNVFDTLLILKNCLINKEAKYYYNLYYEYKKERNSFINSVNSFDIDTEKLQTLAGQVDELLDKQEEIG